MYYVMDMFFSSRTTVPFPGFERTLTRSVKDSMTVKPIPSFSLRVGCEKRLHCLLYVGYSPAAVLYGHDEPSVTVVFASQFNHAFFGRQRAVAVGVHNAVGDGFANGSLDIRYIIDTRVKLACECRHCRAGEALIDGFCGEYASESVDRFIVHCVCLPPPL